MTFQAVFPCCQPSPPPIPAATVTQQHSDFCRKVFCCAAQNVGGLDEHAQATQPQSTQPQAAQPEQKNQTGTNEENSESEGEDMDPRDIPLTPEEEQHLFEKMNSGRFVRIDKES